MNIKNLHKLQDMSGKEFDEIPALIRSMYKSDLSIQQKKQIEFLLSYVASKRPEKTSESN